MFVEIYNKLREWQKIWWLKRTWIEEIKARNEVKISYLDVEQWIALRRQEKKGEFYIENVRVRINFLELIESKMSQRKCQLIFWKSTYSYILDLCGDIKIYREVN